MKTLSLKLKTVFLFDGLGAASTAILLNAVLRVFNKCFRMPTGILTMLAILASIIAIYSFSCFALSEKESPIYLNDVIQPDGIASRTGADRNTLRNAKRLINIIVANCAYCILTFGFVLYYYNRITRLGLTYFAGELLIIVGLIYIEFNAFKICTRNRNI